jgi:pimeloyl-ACP methyl ester carboxylesterase
MKKIAGFPYFELQFELHGKVFDKNELEEVLKFVGQGAVTDLFVMSHGWNNDMAEARKLYKDFFASVREILDANPNLGSAREFAVVAVLWPSKKFADDELIPSGAAGANSPITDAVLRKQIDNLKGVFDNPKSDSILAKAKQLVSQLDKNTSAQKQFVDLVRSLPANKTGSGEDSSDRFFKLASNELFQRLAKPVLAAPSKPRAAGRPAGISGAGGSASIGSFFSGVLSAARNLLNFTTYYQMKERAGVVGGIGLSAVLQKIRAKSQHLKIHLIGHSFGGRLVTAAALGQKGQPVLKVASMALLQAAFSHNGFAAKFEGKPGFFRRVISDARIIGPVLITCTVNDRAVGLAYPLASLIAGQNAAALGDANDPFGGMGRNGAQHTPEANDGVLVGVGGSYSFIGGKLYNLVADTVIKDHSDICGPQVAYALLKAVEKT